MRRLVALMLLGTALAGCNTMSGLGRDIEAAGEAIQRGAKR
jgi:predicted small secreted protein